MQQAPLALRVLALRVAAPAPLVPPAPPALLAPQVWHRAEQDCYSGCVGVQSPPIDDARESLARFRAAV